MKKRFFALFLTMAMLLPAVLLSGCASADSGIMDTANLNATAAGGDSSLPVVTWKMGSVWGAGNVHFTVDQRFAELVSQLTDEMCIRDRSMMPLSADAQPDSSTAGSSSAMVRN